MLTQEETLSLVQSAQAGDNNAKEKLIIENMPLVKSVIRRYKNRGVEDEDLLQLGSMGFVKAINNFSPDFNVKFSTYAVPMIAGEVKRFLRDDGSIKVSRSIKHNAVLIKNYITDFQLKYNREPNIDEISKEFNIEPQEVILTLEASNQIISMDDKVDEEDDSLADRTQDGFSPEKMVDKILIRDLIDNLPAREKRIVIMRYYLDKTQSEIAKIMGVSQVQISRLENKIMESFKTMLKWFINAIKTLKTCCFEYCKFSILLKKLLFKVKKLYALWHLSGWNTLYIKLKYLIISKKGLYIWWT